MQLRFASVVCGTGLPGQIRAHAVGGRKTGTLPDKNNRAIRAKRAGDYIADRNPSLADNDQRRDPPAFGAQRRHDSSQDRRRVQLVLRVQTGRRRRRVQRHNRYCLCAAKASPRHLTQGDARRPGATDTGADLYRRSRLTGQEAPGSRVRQRDAAHRAARAPHHGRGRGRAAGRAAGPSQAMHRFA